MSDKSSLPYKGGLRTLGRHKSSTSEQPLVSVITVVFNGAKYLSETIVSVLNQTYSNIEYIIIDGGSTDGTVDIIRQYESEIDYWISEPDKGISDAFNKGISIAKGDIIGILNADDWYEASAISLVIEAFNKTHAGVLYGNMQCWKNDVKDYLFKANIKLLPYEMSINHPATFIQKSIYDKYGGYNVSYRLAMDYELLTRLLSQKVTFQYIDHLLANLRWDGVSDRKFIEGFKEVKKVKDTYFGKKISHNVYLAKQVTFTILPRLLTSIGLSAVVEFYRKVLSPVKKVKI